MEVAIAHHLIPEVGRVDLLKGASVGRWRRKTRYVGLMLRLFAIFFFFNTRCCYIARTGPFKAPKPQI